MFGNKRKKATEFVIDRMRPLVGLIQHQYGIPEGFWQDEFVLGFMHLMVSFHTQQSGYHLSTTDKGFLIADVYTSLSNLNGAAIGQRATDIATEEDQHPDFKLGADCAHICAFATIGKMSEDGRKIVAAAKDMAAERGNADDTSAVVEILFHELFFQKIAERFGLDSD